jgi:serine/threonine-protein kinase RsbW
MTMLKRPSVTEYTAVIRSPPATVDDAHDFLEAVWTERSDVTAEERMVLETALSELVTNAIQNNPAREVQCEVLLHIADDELVLETTYVGEKLMELPPAEMPEDTAEHGRGLALIRMIVDSLTYRHDGSRNIWRVRRSRSAGSDGAP